MMSVIIFISLKKIGKDEWKKASYILIHKNANRIKVNFRQAKDCKFSAKRDGG